MACAHCPSHTNPIAPPPLDASQLSNKESLTATTPPTYPATAPPKPPNSHDPWYSTKHERKTDLAMLMVDHPSMKMAPPNTAAAHNRK